MNEIDLTPLLKTSDAIKINDIQNEIDRNYEKRQIFRTNTEMMFSVLNDAKFPTNASKYWQAVREQSVHYEELVRLSFRYRENEVLIEKLGKKIEDCTDKYETEELQIKFDEALFNRQLKMQVAKDRVREIMSWHNIMQVLVEAEDFDTEDVDAHQADSYEKILLNKAESITSGTSQAEVFNIIGQLNTIQRIKGKKPLPIDKFIK
tara:strand:- start:10207 stop:10824 length:618 start_codon:yes stop_codon:yes gene_type:complete